MADQDYSRYADYSQDSGDQGYDGEEDGAEYGGDAIESVEGPTDLSSTGRLGNREADDDKKLFIGGLGWGTTQEDLQTHFSKYGGVVQVSIKTNPTTGRSRGFAFVQFSNKDSVERVLMSGPHLINGTQVEPKRVKARRSGYNKIFVGGVDPDLPESEIRAYFERFGKIEGIELPYDKVRNQRKQFCFVAFESEDVVDQVCKQPRQRISGRECDVKKATRRQGGRGGGAGVSWAAAGGYSYDYGVDSRARRGRGRGRGAGYSQGREYGGQQSYGGGTAGGGSYGSYGSYSSPTQSYSSPSYGQSYGSYGSYGGRSASVGGRLPEAGRVRVGHGTEAGPLFRRMEAWCYSGWWVAWSQCGVATYNLATTGCTGATSRSPTTLRYHIRSAAPLNVPRKSRCSEFLHLATHIDNWRIQIQRLSLQKFGKKKLLCFEKLNYYKNTT